MDLESRVGSLEHPLGLVFVKKTPAHEEPEHRAAERLGQLDGVVARPAGPAHEGPVGPEAAIGDDQVEMGVPVGPGAVGLQAGDDPDPEVRLASVVARTAAVTVRAATRARSPSSARR